MKKFTLIKTNDEVRIIDSFYFTENLTDTDGIVGTYKDKWLSIKYHDIVKTSDNIIDLIDGGDLIQAAKKDEDNSTSGLKDAYIYILDSNILKQFVDMGLNIIAIYKQDSKKNFIRVAEKIYGKWRTN